MPHDMRLHNMLAGSESPNDVKVTGNMAANSHKCCCCLPNIVSTLHNQNTSYSGRPWVKYPNKYNSYSAWSNVTISAHSSKVTCNRLPHMQRRGVQSVSAAPCTMCVSTLSCLNTLLRTSCLYHLSVLLSVVI